MTEKTVNYTDEMVERMHLVYDGDAGVAERDAAVAQLAEELGKSARSIIAKLTREGIYVPKYALTKGKAGPTKAILVAAIAEALEVAEEVIESLEKANKSTLTRVLAALRS